MPLMQHLTPIPSMYDRAIEGVFVEAAVIRLERQLRDAFDAATMAVDEAQEAIGGSMRGPLAVALHEITTAMESAALAARSSHDRLRKGLDEAQPVKDS